MVSCVGRHAYSYYCIYGKLHLTTCHEDTQGEQSYSFTLSLTSALDGVGDQRHATAALTPAMTRYPLYRRMRGHKSRSGRMRKVSPYRDSVPDRLARSETLQRLSYPDPPIG
jgi:hypothetical protein